MGVVAVVLVVVAIVVGVAIVVVSQRKASGIRSWFVCDCREQYQRGASR